MEKTERNAWEIKAIRGIKDKYTLAYIHMKK